MSAELAAVDRSRHEVAPELDELARMLPSTLGVLRQIRAPAGALRDAFTRHALGPRHARVLLIVALEREINVTALSRWLGLSRSATSLLVGELHRAGVIVRDSDADDRRRTIVRLVAEHEPAAQAWLALWLDPWRVALSRLSRRDRAGFVAGWRALHHALHELPSHQAST